MNRLARPVTTDEKTKLRRDGQWSSLYLWIDNPLTAQTPAVYTARVNGAPGSMDQVASIAYDGGAGTLSNVKVGMSLWLGSSAGKYDKGQARIRIAPDGSNFYIGEESEISIADDDYITVVDEFSIGDIWARHIRIVSTTPYEDYNIAYSNQHSARAPIPVLGLDAVVELVGNTVTVGFDATDSWVPGGGSKTYSWAAPGASATSGLTTATPTMTYNATGRYRVAGTVTIGGVSFTGYRYVRVWNAGDPLTTQFTLGNIEGSLAEGGWSFQVTLYSNTDADISAVRDRAKVVLCAKDYYGSECVSLGYVEGRENIVASGWIAGETIHWSPEQGSVTFQVRGPQYWFGQVPAFPVGLEHVNSSPVAWTQYQNLTVDAVLWHLLMWRTTAPICIDCRVKADTRLAVSLEAPASNLWEQMKVLAQQSILANIYCNRYGQLFEEIESQYSDDRSTIVEVMDLEKTDLIRDVDFERIVVNPVSRVDLSGVAFDGTTPAAYCALSPGNVFGRFGAVQVQDRLLLSGQAQAVTLAGLLLGHLNNEYPRLPLKLAENNRFLDIAPAMYIRLTLDAGDTIRGISFTLKRFIPRRITYVFNAKTGMLMPEIEFEAETFQQLAIATNCPTDPQTLTASSSPTAPPIYSPGAASGDSLWAITYNP